MKDRPLTDLEQHMARHNWKLICEMGEWEEKWIQTLVAAGMLNGRRGLSEMVITKEREEK